ncbi:protein trichome birefringence-like 28 [Zingiber officinale]|uniref:protein trichome birefringence-like 28 n=1 Tax=Zingiber officinale TaxID=94328 RepID=UPI001C4ADFA3|nr:protein trichome birefringence-like 28 [Zingiber officinale]
MHLPRRKSPLGTPADPSLTVAKLVGSYTRKGSNFSIYALVLAIFLFALVMYSEDLRAMAERSMSPYKSQEDAHEDFPGGSLSQRLPDTLEIAVANATDSAAVPETCDLARGEWVFDDVDFPMYREEQCQYLSQQMSCSRNGRPEAMYQKWRWQPAGCSLPKFDASLVLEWLRGKRMVFIGDSMNRNQWESFVCLMQTVVPPEGRDRRVEGSRIIFTIKEHNASIEFYWAPFLVESNSDDPNIHSIPVRIINPDAIEKHAVHWEGADVLVFNTYIWWMNTFEMRVLRPGARNWTEHDMVVRYEAYDRVLRTLTSWLDRNVDPIKTSVFFMSMSPIHSKSSDWGNPAGIKCAKETLPITNMTGISVGTDMNIFALAKKALGSPALRVPVTFVDITTMSERRKDAHTSVFTVRRGALLTPEQQAKPAEFADCIHWCLPGVPDTWNQLLFVHLLSGRRSRY